MRFETMIVLLGSCISESEMMAMSRSTKPGCEEEANGYYAGFT